MTHLPIAHRRLDELIKIKDKPQLSDIIALLPESYDHHAEC
jgi:hypothetical protein